MSSLLVEDWPLDRIKPYPGNPRKRSKEAIAKVAASIKEFGWRQPIVVDEDGIILVGHTRRDAAELLKHPTAPVHQALALTDAQKRAYRIADNRTNEETQWDLPLLTIELGEIKGLGLDLALTGFNGREIDTLLLPSVEGEDDAPPLPEVAFTRPGDLWSLGEHRLLCGDCTDAPNVARVCGDVKPFLMVTDPPYGVDYDPDWRNRADRANGKPYGARAIGLVSNDDQADWSPAWKLFSGTIAYVWHADTKAHIVAASLLESGFSIRTQIIWAKSNFAIGRGHYHHMHEPCWYAVRSSGHWNGDRSQTTLWKIDKPLKSETGHSTQKPVECMRRPIINHTKTGDYVYDPFLGSGTTLIACELAERRCIGLELEPKYCDVIIQRWQTLSGKVAYNQDGVCFPASDKESKLTNAKRRKAS